MYRLVYEHVNKVQRWTGNTKLGCGYNDLWLSHGLYGHVIVSAVKDRYSDVQAKPGDAEALASAGLTLDMFNSFVSVATENTRKREAGRM